MPTIQTVQLKPLGNRFGIFDAANEKYRGTIDSRLIVGIHDLEREHDVKISLRLVVKPPSLHATIYGKRTQSACIGDYLAEHNLFLQSPQAYNHSTSYFNPQYLIPPDTEFEIIIDNDIDEAYQVKALNSKQKSRISQVLNEAIGPTVFKEVVVSDKLQTTLKEYLSHLMSTEFHYLPPF